MSPDEIKTIVEQAIREGRAFEFWHYVLAATFVAGAAFLGAYLRDKGKNLATKEDARRLTELVESVKTEIREREEIGAAKRAMKREACLDALSVIDAFFSHAITDPRPTAQDADTVKGREAHNKLILACDNPEIADVYLEVLCGSKDGQEQPVTDRLNRFRNLVRTELGFGDPIQLDGDRAWLGILIGDPKNPQSKDKTS